MIKDEEDQELEILMPKKERDNMRGSDNKLSLAWVVAALVMALQVFLLGRNSKGGSVSSSSSNAAQFLTEYDLIRAHSTLNPSFHTNNPTPMEFETAMKATGITKEEYAACNSSIHLDPDRKICAKTGKGRCYKPATGDGDGPVEIKCPPQQGSRWLPDCYQYNASNPQTRDIICYVIIPCVESVSQWAAHSLQLSDRSGWSWYWSGENAGWFGGPDAQNPVFTADSTASGFRLATNLTSPYKPEAELCLKKAALKALSRNGWELASPGEAFKEENWTVVKKTPIK
ncbi:unknown protein [Seminavis robusta]|uniref:Uncharacterized protein n=1 Tax=Seminavis robusta TaxID=568900 RepID=A0A9N8H525_9STRA|nr:unknown protein [Seminavis robusta]|eukprot:Sro76_g041520.1 n/a (286) ;mRNA; r:20013-20870